MRQNNREKKCKGQLKIMKDEQKLQKTAGKKTCYTIKDMKKMLARHRHRLEKCNRKCKT